MRPLLLLPFLLCIFLGCNTFRKECYQKKLDDRQCPSGHDCLAKATLQKFPHINMPYFQAFVINSQDSLDSIAPYYRHCKDIDFSLQSLILFNGSTDSQGDGMEVAGSLCRRLSDGVLLLAVDYSLSGQCLGSTIETRPFSVRVVVPKLPNGQKIQYQIFNINPR